MDTVIVKRQLPSNVRLGRNVNHDSRSWRFQMVPAGSVPLVATRHETHIGVLDQGSVGSCTGNSGVSAIYHGPFVSGVVKPWPKYGPSEAGAVALYSAATAADDYQGTYPPDDTGSDGLSVAKVLRSAGIISGWLNGFSVDQALAQLMTVPLITGVPFYNSMFDVPSSGLFTVTSSSGLAGGHELCVDEYRPAAGTTPAMVGGPNSWGSGWGDGGRFLMKVSDWALLLNRQGDTTSFVPSTEPAPTPTPEPEPASSADAALWAATAGWSAHRHVDGNAAAARAVQAWAKSKGFL